MLDLIARFHTGTRAQAMAWLKTQPYARGLGQPRQRPQERPRRQKRLAIPDKSETRATAAPGASERPIQDAPPPIFPWQHARPELEPDTRQEALELWRAARPVEGTPAALYLRRRGLDPLKLMRGDRPGRWPETLRFSTAHPGIALIIAVHDAATGLVCGVQRVFVTREGLPILKSEATPWAKGKDRKLKRSTGDIDGNAARFSEWPDPDGDWGLAEGPENAMAAQQQSGIPVWAAIHAGNMAKIDPPWWARRAFIFADHDAAGGAATGAAAARYRTEFNLQHVEIIRATAAGADVADLLDPGDPPR